ncbi:MAG: Na+/H+ antiporter NhaC family protein [Clostridium fessum]
MSKILTASHLIEALLYVMTKISMSPALMPIICFFICVVLSSATGSAAGALNTAGPLLIPLSVGMGCNVNLICGAILAGSCFGDNLAPISDTTIASSLSREVDVMKVVRSRFTSTDRRCHFCGWLSGIWLYDAGQWCLLRWRRLTQPTLPALYS